MKFGSAQPYIAAFVIFRKGDKAAFLLRQNTGWGDGYYGLPSGKVEEGETFVQAAIREIKEEVSVNLKPQDLKHALTAHRKSDMSWVDVLFEAENWQGELHNTEPHKHAALEWLDLNALPDNIVPPIRHYLNEIKAGKNYTEYGWET